MEPFQETSIALEREEIVLALRKRLARLTAEGEIPWDGHTAGLIFGLRFFGCTEQSIHNAFQSYGFNCPLLAIKLCVLRYPFLSIPYGQILPQVNGPGHVVSITHSFGVESNLTVDSIRGKPTVLTHKYNLLEARAPLYEQLLYSTDGRLITIEFTEGQLQIRAFERPQFQKKNEIQSV